MTDARGWKNLVEVGEKGGNETCVESSIRDGDRLEFGMGEETTDRFDGPRVDVEAQLYFFEVG